MKKILLFLLISAGALTGFSQSIRSADPAVGQPYLVDAGGNTVNPNTLTVGQVVFLRLSVLNNNVFNSIPFENTRMQISLDPNMQVASPTTLASSPLNAYFNWTLVTTPGGQEIRGQQYADIPANFSGVLEFPVIVTGLTPPAGSTIVANWFVTLGNPNGDVISDAQPGNNSSTLIYRTATALPVFFVNLNAVNSNCALNVTWDVTNEVNVSRYEVLVSNNAAAFRSLGTTSARGNSSYSASVSIPDDFKGQALFVQVKAIDNDGKFTLSNVKTVVGNCNSGRQLIVYGYPNPVHNTNSINIAAKEGIFNGKYRLELVDNNGKLYQVKEVQLDNVISVPFEFRTALSPGQYIIRVSNTDGSQVGTVQFIKVGGVL